MSKLGVEEIRELAREIILKNPEGVRFGTITNEIFGANPETKRNTINTVVGNILPFYPQEIERPARGLYVPRLQVDAAGAPPPPPPTAATLREEDYYPSFADYLKTDLEEVTKAATIGGGALKQKWGTPDVVGLYKARHGALLPFETEVVTAEVKIDPTQSIVAFGQAAAYRLFSHKVYLVLPEAMSEDHESRIEALCLLFGMGLVLFSPGTVTPVYTIRVRAQRHSPDPFYLNDFAERLRSAYPDEYAALFD